MTWEWPQIVEAALLVLSSGISIGRWGEKKSGCYDGFDVFGPVLVAWLLYMGGFWR